MFSLSCILLSSELLSAHPLPYPIILISVLTSSATQGLAFSPSLWPSQLLPAAGAQMPGKGKGKRPAQVAQVAAAGKKQQPTTFVPPPFAKTGKKGIGKKRKQSAATVVNKKLAISPVPAVDPQVRPQAF
jgi:hypothetical protein